MKELANVEFMLLQIICEKKEISGYEIVQLVNERGYREWADIGTTSIYVGLNKLSDKGFVDSYVDTTKKGKGPIPKRFMINEEGKTILQQQIIQSLSSSRERDFRFDLALAAIPFLPQKEVITALEKRKVFLSQAAKNLEMKFASQGGKKLPFHVKALFRHPLFLISHEITFIESLIADLENFTE